MQQKLHLFYILKLVIHQLPVTNYLSYHLIKAEAHVKPLPKAAKTNISFSLILFCSHNSLKIIGIVAAVVFPNL